MSDHAVCALPVEVAAAVSSPSGVKTTCRKDSAAVSCEGAGLALSWLVEVVGGATPVSSEAEVAFITSTLCEARVGGEEEGGGQAGQWMCQASWDHVQSNHAVHGSVSCVPEVCAA